jgi:hypothetical protein
MLLFVIAVFVIGFGFYIEAILDCVFPTLFPPPNGLISNMALPASSSIIPGAIVGFFMWFLGWRAIACLTSRFAYSAFYPSGIC